jgi:hypothetical protein
MSTDTIVVSAIDGQIVSSTMEADKHIVPQCISLMSSAAQLFGTAEPVRRVGVTIGRCAYVIMADANFIYITRSPS